MDEYKFGHVDWVALEHADGRSKISFSEAEDEGIIYRSPASLGEEFVALSPDDSPTPQSAVQVALIACDSTTSGESCHYHTSAEVFRELVDGWRFPQAAIASGPACGAFYELVDGAEECCWYGLSWQDADDHDDGDDNDRRWQHVFVCQMTSEGPAGVQILFLCTKDLKPVISERLQEIFDMSSNDSSQVLPASVHLVAASEAARGLKLAERRLDASVNDILGSSRHDMGVERAASAIEDAAECLKSVRMHADSARQYSRVVTKLQRIIFSVGVHRDVHLRWCDSVVSNLLQDACVSIAKSDSWLHGLRDLTNVSSAKLGIQRTSHLLADNTTTTRQPDPAPNRKESTSNEDTSEPLRVIFQVLVFLTSFGLGVFSIFVSLVMFVEGGPARSDGTYLKLIAFSLVLFAITWTIAKRGLVT